MSAPRMTARQHFDVAVKFYNEQAYDQALVNFTEAIIMDPTQSHYYANRAAVYNAKGNISAALKDYNHAEKLGITDPLFYLNRGEVHMNNQDMEKAFADFKKLKQCEVGSLVIKRLSRFIPVLLKSNQQDVTQKVKGLVRENLGLLLYFRRSSQLLRELDLLHQEKKVATPEQNAMHSNQPGPLKNIHGGKPSLFSEVQRRSTHIVKTNNPAKERKRNLEAQCGQFKLIKLS